MNAISDITHLYLDAYHKQAPQWLKGQREDALQRFADLGVPSRRDEDWRYDDLSALAQTPPQPKEVTAHLTANNGVEGLNTLRIQCNDGQMQMPSSPLPEGLSITRLQNATPADQERVAKALQHDGDNAFAAFGAAMMQDGLIVTVAAGAEIRAPLEILHQASGKNPALHTALFIHLGHMSRLCFSETHAGNGTYWANERQHIHLAEGARLCHHRLLKNSSAATHTAHRHISLDKAAHYTQHALYSGGKSSRDQLDVVLRDAQAKADLHGISLGKDGQNISLLTRLIHEAAHAESHQLFKSVLKDKAKSAFQGRITVKEGAIGTEALMANNNLLLDRGAEANAKPELMIFADDVKCAHGATVGEMDKAALFYLLARGIPPMEARAMLVEAFIGEVLDGIEILEIRNHYLGHVQNWLKSEGDRA